MSYTHVRINSKAGNPPRIQVRSNYHPDAPKVFKKVGGQWNAADRAWEFDARDEPLVRSLLVDLYGTTGDDAPELVTLRVTVPDDVYERHQGYYIAGREVALAYGRDSGATLGPGVVVLEGTGARSGGSVKNWTTTLAEGSVFEIRDIPKPAADRAIANPPDDLVIELADVPPSEETLRAERERLQARLAEIDKLLGDSDG